MNLSHLLKKNDLQNYFLMNTNSNYDCDLLN